MQQNQTGDFIVDIKKSKKDITIILSNHKIKIPIEYELTFPLYVGKFLTKQEEKNIYSQLEINYGLKIADKILRKRNISENELISKLLNKGINMTHAKKVVAFYKENNVINDSMYMNDLFFYYESKLFGERKIVDCLIKKGIPDQEIKKIRFKKPNEIDKAKKLLERTDVLDSNSSFTQLKRKCFGKLHSYGFTNEIIKEVVSNFIPYNKEREVILLNDEIERLFIKGSKKENILKHLLKKGFKYDLIKERLTFYGIDD